jgi:hypothetical protein
LLSQVFNALLKTGFPEKQEKRCFKLFSVAFFIRLPILKGILLKPKMQLIKKLLK